MERNSDVVAMASYAPLFVNVNHRGWNPDLINFDSSRAYGIPSYHVQKLFSEQPRRCDRCRVDVEPPELRGTAHGRGRSAWEPGPPRPNSRTSRSRMAIETLFVGRPQDGTEGWKLLGGDWKVKDGRLAADQRSGEHPRGRRRQAAGPTTRSASRPASSAARRVS